LAYRPGAFCKRFPALLASLSRASVREIGATLLGNFSLINAEISDSWDDFPTNVPRKYRQ
jgi:hypothetical protein